MQPIDFKSISTGQKFSGPVPSPLAIPVTRQIGKNITATVVVSAKPGDSEYDNVLEAWMFMNGYLGPRNSK